MEDLILKISKGKDGLNYECPDLAFALHDIALDIITDFADGKPDKLNAIVGIVAQVLARENSGTLEKDFLRNVKSRIKFIRAELEKLKPEEATKRTTDKNLS